MNALKILGFSFLALAFALTGCKLEKLPLPCPRLISLSPNAAKYDEIVSVKGSKFIAGAPQRYNLTVNGVSVPVMDVPDSNTLRFKVPLGIGNGTVSVSVVDGPGCGNAGLTFMYKYTVKAGNIVNPYAGTVDDPNCATCFRNPEGIDLDAAGNLYVADFNHSVIKKVDTARRVTIYAGVNNTLDYLNSTRLLSRFKNPSDVVVASNGDVYVADKTNNCIRKISGEQVTTLTGINLPVAGSYVDGTLAVARFQEPTCIATDGGSLLMVTESARRRLRLIDIAGNKVSSLPNMLANTFTTPYGVTYSDKWPGDSRIFVADVSNATAIRGSTLAGALSSIPSSFIAQPLDLSFDADGNLFVLEKSKNQIFVIYKNNTFEALAGNGINGQTNLFKMANSIVVNKAKKLIYVSDEGAHTIVQIKFE